MSVAYRVIDTPDDSDVLLVAVVQRLTRAHGKRGVHSGHAERTPARTTRQRSRLMAAQSGLLIFTRDHLFPSPSTATMALMGAIGQRLGGVENSKTKTR